MASPLGGRQSIDFGAAREGSVKGALVRHCQHWRSRLAIDDRYGSSWISAPSNKAWPEFDLGVNATRGRLEVYWGKQAPTTYAFEARWDGKAWSRLCGARHGEGGEDVFAFPPVAARCVRWSCETPPRDRGWEIVDVNLYGPAGCDSNRCRVGSV